jgi:rsbT co-antagonist protein RsbR
MTEDGAERGSLERRLADATRELSELDERISTLMDAAPFGVAIIHGDGSTIVNPVGNTIFGSPDTPPPDAPADEWQRTFGFFQPDKTTPIQIHELPGVRAMSGMKVEDARMWVQPPDGSPGIMVDIAAAPLPGIASITLVRDVTSRARLEEELLERRATLEERDAQNRALIERLRVALDALATPVLEVDEGVLVVPIVGLVDTQRAAQISEHLLHEVVRHQASWVVIDATGVEVVDTATAAALARVVAAVELLGARCVASGLSATVVQTMVELGVDLARLETHRSLRQALERCAMRTQGQRRRAEVRR